MATVTDAVAAKVLEGFVAPEWERRSPIRQLWAACAFWDFVDNWPALHDAKKGGGGRSLFEHMEMTFCDFQCAERFPAGVLRRMMPEKNGIWKVHSPKLRVYGWCPSANSFVAVAAALENDTKTDKRLNDRKRDEVLAFIKRNGLSSTVKYGDVLAIFPPNN